MLQFDFILNDFFILKKIVKFIVVFRPATVAISLKLKWLNRFKIGCRIHRILRFDHLELISNVNFRLVTLVFLYHFYNVERPFISKLESCTLDK